MNKKKRHTKEALVALGISSVLLALVIFASIWYENHFNVKFDTIGMIVSDAIGFVLVFFIIFHYEKRTNDGND